MLGQIRSKMEWGYVRKAKGSDVLDQIRVISNKQHSIFQEKTVKIVKAELNGFGETTWNLEKGHVQFKIPEGMSGEELSDWAENKASYLIAFLELGEVDFLAVKEDNDDCGDNKTLAELIASAWFEWTQSLEHPTYDTDDE